MPISNDLIAAYKGYYEKELERDHRAEYIKECEGQEVVRAFEQWIERHICFKILADTPKDRLAIYLEWNGILGWTNRIWEISQGGL